MKNKQIWSSVFCYASDATRAGRFLCFQLFWLDLTSYRPECLSCIALHTFCLSWPSSLIRSVVSATPSSKTTMPTSQRPAWREGYNQQKLLLHVPKEVEREKKPLNSLPPPPVPLQHSQPKSHRSSPAPPAEAACSCQSNRSGTAPLIKKVNNEYGRRGTRQSKRAIATRQKPLTEAAASSFFFSFFLFRRRDGWRLFGGGGGGCGGFNPFWITPLFLSLSLSLPWAITLKLTWLVLIQITLTMHTNGNHVSTHKPQKNALVQIPMTLLHSKIYSRVQPARQLQEAQSFFWEFCWKITKHKLHTYALLALANGHMKKTFGQNGGFFFG